jgi:hypothetical protein
MHHVPRQAVTASCEEDPGGRRKIAQCFGPPDKQTLSGSASVSWNRLLCAGYSTAVDTSTLSLNTTKLVGKDIVTLAGEDIQAKVAVLRKVHDATAAPPKLI